jgi:putative colanic acid biosynthesis UDP-glucose lipid carrier transferase
VRIIADCHRFCTSTASMNLFGTFPLLTIRTSPLDDPAKQRLKRIFELCFTSILFVTIFWWLFPCIALLIKLSSSGPVLFRQERQGLNNKRITCYKFRSMVSDSATINANGQYLQATLNILRVTPIGRFLRKTATGAKPGKQVRCRNVLTLTYGILKTIAYGSIARSFSKH